MLTLHRSQLHPIGDVRKAALGNTTIDRELLSYLMLKGAVINVGYLSISVCNYLNLALQRQGFADSDKLKFPVFFVNRSIPRRRSSEVLYYFMIKADTRLGNLLWKDIRNDTGFLPSDSYEIVSITDENENQN